ncbi:MAG: DUF4142 domain-containing protein [Planctomycetes bacterium]|nr:DUF4142 domain-containing protein [Planctomycetota bacterium]
MSASPKLRFGIAAAALSCLIAGYAVAQQQQNDLPRAPERPRTGQIDRPTTQPGQPYTARFRGDRPNAAAQQDVQRFLAVCLLSRNQAEVEIAEFAQQQSQSPEVKEFAQKLVQDHGKFVKQLKPLAGTQPSGRTETTPSLDAAGQTDAERSVTTTRAAGGNAAVDQLLAIENQIIERCKQAMREELQQKQGVEFDKCYIGAQIGGHTKALAALEVIQEQGPGQLQQFAQQAQPIVQQHLDHAKQIMKQLEGSGAVGNRAARQPSERQR